MRIILILFILLSIQHPVFSQIDSTLSVTDSLEIEISELRLGLDGLNRDFMKMGERINLYGNSVKIEFDKLQSNIDSLAIILSDLNASLDNVKKELTNKIETNKSDTESEVNSLYGELSSSKTFTILGLILLVVMLFSSVIYIYKKMSNSENKLFHSIESTRHKIEEEYISLDSKTLDLLAKQLTVNKDKDHSLALKVADEIVRIQKNLNHMEDSVKGKKQLNAAVGRIHSNFEANGYEIVDMLNKPYNDGMKVVANFIPDENLEAGTRIITRIIKPQVNYNNVMIQSAQIEVSQGI